MRFKHENGAMKAISNLDGKTFFGLKLKVSKAKYNRDGRPFHREHNGGEKVSRTWRPIVAPALRDGRKYSEVLLGSKVVEPSKNREMNTAIETINGDEDQQQKVTLHISENPVMLERLSFAAVVDLKKPSDIKTIEAIITENKLDAVGVSALSSYKVVIFFENELAVQHAVDVKSPLKMVFNDIRRWSDDEYDGERYVWLECTGLHPKCWGQENFRAIGNYWGTTVKFVHVINGSHSLMAAKILVRTKCLKKIEGKVCLKWKSGSCVIWVQEVDYEELSEEVFEDDSDDDEEHTVDATPTVMPTVVNGRKEGTHNIGSNKVHANREIIDSGISKDDTIIMVNEDGIGYLMHKSGNSVTTDNIEVELLNDEAIHVQALTPTDKEKRTHGDENVGLLNMDESCANLRQEGEEITKAQQDVGGVTNSGLQIISGAQVHCEETSDVSIGAICRHGCTLEQVEWFDPIASVEVNSSQPQISPALGFGTQRRPRGRPKRNATSLPEPLYIQATPSPRQQEAVQTWKCGKTVGVRSTKEKEVISQLRKSKRLMLLEDQTPTA